MSRLALSVASLTMCCGGVKTYEPYAPASDDEYYLGLGKETVLKAKWDMLGSYILNNCSKSSRAPGKLCEPSWAQVPIL